MYRTMEAESLITEMLNICEDFSDDHDTILNASKSQLLQNLVFK